MDLTDQVIIKDLAKKNGIHPNRHTGQNFLVSKTPLEKIISAANLKKDEKVLEIGPGFGTLSLELLKTGAEVLAFEIDKKLASFLSRYEVLYPNFKVIQSDVLKSWPALNKKLTDLDYKLIANLPYNITSKVLRIFTEDKPRPSEMIVMVQKEVAERVIAKPGEMSILAVAIQFYGQPKKLFDVKSDNFWPEPEVDSSVLQISNIGKDNHGFLKKLSPINPKIFFRTVKIGFSAKRKQLHNNLSNGFKISDEKTIQILGRIGIKPSIRAQNLKIEDWISITRLFN